MKTLLMVDSSLGQARGHLAKRMLEAAAAKAGLTLVESLQDAELVAVAGQAAPADAGLNGKLVYVGEVEQAVREPDAFLARAKAEAETYQAPQAAAPVKANEQKRIVAITACPTGVAHTFMAAEAIESEAKKRGWWVKVETRGSVGAGNAITPEEVAAADLVIVAADIEVDLDKFAGKPMYRTSTGLALKKTAQELDKAQAEAEVFQPQQRGNAAPAAKKKEGNGPYRHLLTGVSYMLPMVVAGGLCIALSFVFGIKAFEVKGTLAAALMQIGGGSAFALMVPVLAGFIAFSIADRPGLTPGLIGGMLAVSTGAGFLGGIIAGFLAGYVARAISSKLRLPQSMEALKPILIIPLVASLITGLIMIYVVGTPVAKIMEGLTHWLQSLGTANAVLLGAILGGMMCTDMGAGEQSGLRVRRGAAQLLGVCADGSHHGRRYGAAAGDGSGDAAGAPQVPEIRTGRRQGGVGAGAVLYYRRGDSIRRPRSDARVAVLHRRRGADRRAVDGLRRQADGTARRLVRAADPGRDFAGVAVPGGDRRRHAVGRGGLCPAETC